MEPQEIRNSRWSWGGVSEGLFLIERNNSDEEMEAVAVISK